MPRGDNKVTVNFTTEMKNILDRHRDDLYPAFFVAQIFLERYKDEFIAKYGQAKYDEQVARFSRPDVQVRNEATQRKKESLAQKRRELELREKELEVKNHFLEAETERMRDKHEETTEEKGQKAKDEYKALIKEKKEIQSRIAERKNKGYTPVQELETRLIEIDQKINKHNGDEEK